MRSTIIILLGILFIPTGCKKEEPTPETNNSNEENLDGVWIEGSWRFLYTDADSIINIGNWTVSDTINDPETGNTNVHWTNDNDSLLYLTTFVENDTAWVKGEYVGDGYNNGVKTVNVTGNSYLVNDVISVDGENYTILNYEPNGAGLDDEYRYFVELEINSPYEGCKYYLELAKRQND